MVKMLSLLISFSLLFTSVAPSYAQVRKAEAAQRASFQLPADGFFANQTDGVDVSGKQKALFESAILEQVRQQNLPKAGSAEARLQRYCSLLVTCTQDVSEDAFTALLLNEAQYKQDVASVAASMRVNLKGIDLSAAYKERQAEELKAYEAMFADFEQIYNSSPKNSRAVNQLVASVLPAALAMGVKSKTAGPVARRIYQNYFSYLNKTYPTVKSLKKAAEERGSKGSTQGQCSAGQQAAPASLKLADVLSGALVGYAFVIGQGQLKDVTEFVGKAAVTPFALQTVTPYVSMLLTLKDYKTLENFLKAASIMEVKLSDQGKFWEFMNGVGAMFSVSSYIENGSADLSSKYAGGNVTKYGFYCHQNGGLGNVWEDVPGVIAADGSPEALAVMSRVFYNGLSIMSSTNLSPKADWANGVLIPFVIGAIGTRKLERRPLEGHGAFKKYFGSNLNLLGAAELSLLTYKMYDLDDATYKRVRGILTAPYWAAVNDKISPEAAAAQMNFSVHSVNGRSASGFNQMVYNPANRTGLVLNDSPSARKSAKALYGEVLTYAGVVDVGVSAYFMWQMAKSVTGMLQWARNFGVMLKSVRAGMPAGNASWAGAMRTVLQRKSLPKEISRLEKLTARAKSNPTRVNKAAVENAQARVELATSRGIAQESAANLAKEQTSFEAIQQKLNANQPLTPAESKAWGNMQRYMKAEQSARSTQAALKDAKIEAKGPDYFEEMAIARRANEARDAARMNNAHTQDLKNFDTPERAASELARKTYLASEEGQAATQAARAKANKRAALMNKYPVLRVLSKQATTLTASILLNTVNPSVSNSAMSVSSLSRGFKPVMEMVDPRLLARVIEGRTALFPGSNWSLGNANGAVKTPASFFEAARAELGLKAPLPSAVAQPAIAAPKLVTVRSAGMNLTLVRQGKLNPAAVSALVSNAMSRSNAGYAAVGFPIMEVVDEVARKKEISKHTKEVRDALNSVVKMVSMSLTDWSDPKTQQIFLTYAQQAIADLKLPQEMKDRIIAQLRESVDETFDGNLITSLPVQSVFVPRTGVRARFVGVLRNVLPASLVNAPSFSGLNDALGETVRFQYQKVLYSNRFGVMPYAEGTSVPRGFKEYVVAKGYNFISTKDQYKKDPEVASAKSDMIANLILRNPKSSRDNLIWIMASAASPVLKLTAYNRIVDSGDVAPTANEVLARHSVLHANGAVALNVKHEEQMEMNDALKRMLAEQENRMTMLPSETPLLSLGITEDQLVGVNANKIGNALYSKADVEGIMQPFAKRTFWNNTTYSNVLPVYLRHVDGTVSSDPRVYLVLNKNQKVTVPLGYRMVLDEIGQWKLAPYNLREIRSSRMPYNKVWRWVYKTMPNFFDGNSFIANNPRRLYDWPAPARHRVFETPLASAELSSISYLLSREGGSERVAVLRVNEADQFASLMQSVALIAGADLGASLSSQFKKMFSNDIVTVGLSGFGYFSPLVVNMVKPLINKYGYYRSIQAGLVLMSTISAVGWLGGMDGTFDVTHGGGVGLAIAFMATAIVTASLFSTLAGQVLKSAYPDPTVFGSQNMAFTTTKGLSRLLVTIIPAVVISLSNTLDLRPAGGDELNWSMLVPMMTFGSLYGLWMLRHSRLYSEHVASLTNPAAKEKLTKEEQRAQRQEAKRRKAALAEQYRTQFKHDLSPITRRLGRIYEAYAPINSVAIGVTAAMLYPSATALAIGASGLFLSWLVRKLADRLIKSKVITEDQLTGLSLPLMALGVGSLLVSPYGSSGMMLGWFLMYLSTPTFGVSENTRMMNYVASYYKAQRESVRNNDELSKEEKDSKMKQLVEDEKAMKVEASAAYNRFNAKGLFTILGIAAFFALFKQMPTAEALAPYATQAADALRLFGDDPSTILKGAPIDFAVYRLAALLPFLISSWLAISNRHMVADGYARLASSVVLTPEDIKNNNDILGKLRFNRDRVKNNMEELSGEVEELARSVMGYTKAKNSEAKMQGVLNRMVWANNRLKAILDNTAVDASTVSEELISLRTTAANFQEMLKHNDFSEGLRQQTEGLLASVDNGIVVSTDEDILRYLQLLATEVDSSQSGTMRQLYTQIEEYLRVSDLSRLENARVSLRKVMKDEKVNEEVIEDLSARGDRIFQALKQKTGRVERAELVYLPEVKLSLVDNAKAWFHDTWNVGKDPAKGVFSGTKVQHYEQAKAMTQELDKMLSEMKNKRYYDGMFKEFGKYYEGAIKELEKYVKENKVGDEALQEKRVMELQEELSRLYREFMMDAPKGASPKPAASVAPSEPVKAN